MLATKDIAWVGGLLEGEGSFGNYKRSPVIQLKMTDRDTVERAATLFGVKLSTYVHKPKGKVTYKDVWSCSVHGYRAIAWMMTLYQFFGERRQGKIQEVIAQWKLSTQAQRGPRGKPFMAKCHPDRRIAGRGLCDQCYMAKWRDTHRERIRAYERSYMRKWRADRKRKKLAANTLFTLS